MLPDVNQYLPYLQEFDLSDEKKAELVRIVWFLLESQVDQAFDDHVESNEFKKH